VYQRAKSGRDILFSITGYDDGFDAELPFKNLDEGGEVFDRPAFGRAAAAGVHDDKGMPGWINMMGGEERLYQRPFGVSQA
jgi:hypothetical protein